MLAEVAQVRTQQPDDEEMSENRPQLNGKKKKKHRSRRAVQRRLSRRGGEFMRAYTKRLDKKPDLQGMMKLGFVIRPDGVPDSIRVISTTLKDKPLEEEVVSILRQVQFEPVPPEAGTTRHQYALPFVPVGTSR